jgi:aspartate oxidase
MRIIEGEEQVTTGPSGADYAGTVRGEGWIAVQRDGRHYLEYDAGEIQSRDVSLPITADEFARLRADHEQFLPIVHANGG